MTVKTTSQLEVELASKEKECDYCFCVCLCHTDQYDKADLFCKNESCCKDSECEGTLECTGVVPLIDGSRRKCKGIWQNYKGTEWDFNHSKACCEGRGWVPDLTGMKVLAWMLESGRVQLVESKGLVKLIGVTWLRNRPLRVGQWTRVTRGATPEEALLRAALAGAEATG